MQAQISKARLNGAEGRVLEALQAARAVRQACVASPLGTELALVALEGAGRLSDALDEAKAGVDRLPHDPTCRVLWARLLARKGNAAQARERRAPSPQ